MLSLINLHNTVNLPDEPEASEESDTSCKKEEAEDHDAGVSEVQEGRSSSLYVQFSKEVVNTVYS